MKERTEIEAGDYIKIGWMHESDIHILNAGDVFLVIDRTIGGTFLVSISDDKCRKCGQGTEWWVHAETEVEYMDEVTALQHFANVASMEARDAAERVVLARQRLARRKEQERIDALEQVCALIEKYDIKQEEIAKA